jgi:hypothetical protein
MGLSWPSPSSSYFPARLHIGWFGPLISLLYRHSQLHLLGLAKSGLGEASSRQRAIGEEGSLGLGFSNHSVQLVKFTLL